jgi:putative transposase
MPEHVHLVVAPSRDASSVSLFLGGIKRPMSVRYKALLESRKDRLAEELTIQERPGKSVSRFWQEGSGHDRTLPDQHAIVEAIRYVHRNPVKRELCAAPEEWAWSSFRQYADLPPSPDVLTVKTWRAGRLEGA